MKIALVYVNAGNGHYIPAKNLYDSFRKLSVEAMLVDFQKDILKNENASVGELEIWRNFSKYPKYQRFTAFLAQKMPLIRIIVDAYNKKKGRTFKNYLKDFVQKNGITHIIMTAVTPFTFYITEMKKIDKLDVEIICFPPDFVYIRNTSIRNKSIDKYLCPSQECHNYMTKNGIKNSKILDIPFPIQNSFYEAKTLTQNEARTQLDLDNEFTILYQIGGVGEGSLKLLKLLSKYDEKVRVIILGKLQPNMQKKLKQLAINKKRFAITMPGFLNNPGL